ncbi:MAG TPA: M56 family metallopeptidase, partial [Pirellulales bacterium]|jgi:WD40 repeat protein/beta-lactamase regulating signal transducer with metallopeptidase domain|nr:M56 family metallopeptidase [Pirellulales bacterium]
LVLVLLAVEFLLRRRVRAVIRYWLWMLVLVKLVLPVDLRTPVSLAYWLPSGGAASSRPVDRDSDSGVPRSQTIHSAALVADSRPPDLNSIPGATAADSAHNQTMERPDVPRRPTQTATAANVTAPLQWRGSLFACWILAVAILLTMVGRRAMWIRRITRQATDAPRELEDLLRDCMSQMGMKGQVKLRISDHLGSPAICGLWRPTILLPRGFPAGLDREQIRMVFVHELVHWRRGDLQVNCCQTLLQTLYFYSPAVWIANVIIRRLREQAVDETVLATLRGQSERYVSALLDIASAALQPAEAMLRLIGVVESRRALSTRIRHILNRPVPRSAKLGLTGLAVITASGLLLLPMGQREQASAAQDEPAVKARDTSDNLASESPDAKRVEPTAASKGMDIDGDPLPAGVIARLGAKRFRTARQPVALTYGDDRKTLVQLTSDGWLQRWDPTSGRLLNEKRLWEHQIPRNSAALGIGRVAACGSYFDDERGENVHWLGVFDQSSQRRILQLNLGEQWGQHLALSPDGRTLAYGRDKVHLVDIDRQTEIASRDIGVRSIESIVFAPDGKSLAVGGNEGNLLFWHWSANEEPRSIEIPSNPNFGPYPVWAFVFSPDGATVAVVNGNHDFKKVYLFDAVKRQIVRTFGAPGGEDWGERSLTFSPDGKMLATSISHGSAGGGVALWDVSSGRLVRRLQGLFGDAYFLTFSPNGRQLAASCEWNSTMCVWNLDTGEPLVSQLAAHVQPPNSIRFLPDDQRLVTAGDDGTIRIWNLADSRQERVMQHIRDQGTYDSGIRGMDVSPDGKYIASSSYDDTVRLWETATSREIFRLPGNGHLGGHLAVRFTPDSKRFASWGNDLRLYLWDVSTGKAVREFQTKPAGLNTDPDSLGNPPFSSPMGSGPMLSAACFSADASTLTLLLDTARRFSVRTGEELPAIEYQKGSSGQMALSPDSHYLLSANWGVRPFVSKDGKTSGTTVAKNHPVELRSLSDGKVIVKMDMAGSGAGPMTFSPDGSLVAISEIDYPRIELRKVPDLSEVSRIDLPSRPHAVEFSHSSKLMAVSIADSTVLVWDLEHLPNQKSP